MTFHPLELDNIADYSNARELGPEWTKSPLHELVLAASSTKKLSENLCAPSELV
jgi:hypothetical protein